MYTIGTSHFTDVYAARRYYVNQAATDKAGAPALVAEKMRMKEIHIGAPDSATLKPGDTLKVNDEGRYIIITNKL